MKVMIIGLPTKNVGNQLPNLGAIAIAQQIRETGHEVLMIDLARYRLDINTVVNEILSLSPDLVGISGIITSYYYFEPLVEQLKRTCPDLPIVVGGGITCVPEVIESHTRIDYMIRGEGENAIKEIICMLDNNKSLEDKDIPGVFVRVGKKFKQPGVIQSYPDITNISFPAYDLYDMEFYIESMTQNAYRFIKFYPHLYEEIGDSLKFFPLTLTRGCPFNCKFCYRYVKKFRHPSIETAISHLKIAKEQYGCLGITQLDELTVADKKWFIAFCDAVKEEIPGLKIFSGAGRANLLTTEIITHAKKAGFIRFGCGIESGSQKILDNLNKKVTVEQNYRAIKDVKANGMMATCNFIFGTPGEDKQTLKETEKFLANTLDPRDYAVNLAVAYPDTPLFDFAIDNQILRKDQIHDYVLNAGFGDYPLNLSEFKTGKLLVRAVSIMQIRLMFHFLRKERLYKELLKLLLKRIRIEIGFVLKLFIPSLINTMRKKKDVEILNAFNRKRQTEYFNKEAT